MTRVPATMTTGLSSDSHTHTIANVTNLQTSLDGKAASSHTHSGSDITAASIAPSKLTQWLTFDTAKASTSGVNVDFTGIPAWAKRIQVLFYRVSTNGSSLPVVRVGTSAGIISTGYESVVGYSSAGGTLVSDTQHFGLAPSSAWSSGITYSGILTLSNITGNNWVSSLSAASYNSIQVCGGGSVTLAAALDRVRVTTVNGTDAFDAGSINISYEG